MAKHLHLQARAEPETVTTLRREVTGFATEMGAGGDVCEAVRLAVSEALTNVVVHAYPDGQGGDVTVEAWRDGDGHLMVRVSDDGRGLTPIPDGRGLGLGLGLMAHMADGFLISTRDGSPGTVVSLRFALP